MLDSQQQKDNRELPTWNKVVVISQKPAQVKRRNRGENHCQQWNHSTQEVDLQPEEW